MKLFHFDAAKTRSRLIAVEGCQFRVTLESVRDWSGESIHTMKQMRCYEYSFTVNEL